MLSSWWKTLEVKGFRLSKIKTEYIEFKLSNSRRSKVNVKIRETSYSYLRTLGI